MRIILSHPTGNANVRAATSGLAKAGLLSKFYTTIAAYPGELIYQAGSINALSEIKRRTFDPALKAITKRWPWKEAARLFATRAGFNNLTKHEHGIFSIDAVYKDLDRRVASCLRRSTPDQINGVYCYEDGAEFTFKAATKRGIKCFYDLPIGYWRCSTEILELEKEKWPEWAPTLIGLKNSEEKLRRKDEELILANKIFVASSFTAQTLKHFPGSLPPIQVIPYGFPPVAEKREYKPAQNRPLRILFVGGLSQRKGIADLFTAIKKQEKHFELTVVGKRPKNPCKVLDDELSKHTWISGLPHDKILELMRAHDLLVFPSLFEGFGLVVTEAMSQGTPVITTGRTCGADLIEDGVNGWLINAGHTRELEQKLENCLGRPQDIAEVGRNAMKSALARPWSAYGAELAAAVASPVING